MDPCGRCPCPDIIMAGGMGSPPILALGICMPARTKSPLACMPQQTARHGLSCRQWYMICIHFAAWRRWGISFRRLGSHLQSMPAIHLLQQ